MTIARSRAIDELRRRVPEPRDPDASTTLALTADEDPELSPDALVERWRVAHMLVAAAARGGRAAAAALLRGAEPARGRRAHGHPARHRQDAHGLGARAAARADRGGGGVTGMPLDDLERHLERLPKEAWDRPTPPPPPWPAEEEAPPARRRRLVLRPVAAALASLVLLAVGVGAGLLLSGDDDTTAPGGGDLRAGPARPGRERRRERRRDGRAETGGGRPRDRRAARPRAERGPRLLRAVAARRRRRARLARLGAGARLGRRDARRRAAGGPEGLPLPRPLARARRRRPRPLDDLDPARAGYRSRPPPSGRPPSPAPPRPTLRGACGPRRSSARPCRG